MKLNRYMKAGLATVVALMLIVTVLAIFGPAGLFILFATTVIGGIIFGLFLELVFDYD